MGNIDSKTTIKTRRSKIIHNKQKIETVEPVLSERQVDLLLESWDVLKHDISKVGVVMFMK